MASLEGHQLRPYHVVVTASYEELLAKCLRDIPYRRRPKLKAQVGRTSLASEACIEENVDNVFAELDARFGSLSPERTFICCSPLFRNAESVCQSTADHYRSTTNPRRYGSR